MPCPCGGAAAAAGSSSAYDRSGRQHKLRGANGTFFPRRRLAVSRRHPHLVAGPRITESDYPTVQVDAAHIDSSPPVGDTPLTHSNAILQRGQASFQHLFVNRIEY